MLDPKIAVFVFAASSDWLQSFQWSSSSAVDNTLIAGMMPCWVLLNKPNFYS